MAVKTNCLQTYRVKAAATELRQLLAEWDPIGIADGDDDFDHSDEYDCLVFPLLSRLTRGANETELASFLGEELRAHFGLGNGKPQKRAAKRIVAWWGART